MAALNVAPEQLRFFRLAVHRLDRRRPLAELQQAAGVCGLQNSPPGAWETALFQRLEDCTLADLQKALYVDKSLLQAWSIRGVPLVFPTAESDVFLSPLTARPGEEPWIYTQGVGLALDYLGMPWEEALALVRQAVGYLEDHTVQSKEELDRVLAAQAAVLLPPEQRARWNAPTLYGRTDRQSVGGAVVSFALRPCSFSGLVVFGQRQGISPTFTSYRRWLGRDLAPRPDAEACLVRKFLHAYGPSTPARLADWLGSTPVQARRLWQTVEEELAPVTVEGKRGWMLAEDMDALTRAVPPEEPLRLLGAHDPYLDARDRALLLEDTALQRKVWKTAANPNVVLRQGRVAGIWQTKTVRGKLESTVTLFEDFSPAERTALAEKTEEYAAFRGLTLKQCTVQPL